HVLQPAGAQLAQRPLDAAIGPGRAGEALADLVYQRLHDRVGVATDEGAAGDARGELRWIGRRRWSGEGGHGDEKKAEETHAGDDSSSDLVEVLEGILQPLAHDLGHHGRVEAVDEA